MVIDDAALETKLLIVHKLIESIEISGKSFQFKVGFIVSSFWNLFSIVFLKDQRLFTSLFVRSLKEFHWLQIFENCFIIRYKKILTSSVVLQKVNNYGENEFSFFFSLHSRFSSLSFIFTISSFVASALEKKTTGERLSRGLSMLLAILNAG